VGRGVRDPSPYAGTTVQIRPGMPEIGGLSADVVDWYERTSGGLSWRDAVTTDSRADSYAIRRAMGELPDDDNVLSARVDGMSRLIHCTEIVGEQTAVDAQFGPTPVRESEIGVPCPACAVPLVAGVMVAVRQLGPGADPQARADAHAGLPYQAVTVELHWACATGDVSYEEN
jgi:hypothetical protein